MKKIKILFLILAVACLIFALCACSCEAPDSDNSTSSSHEHSHAPDNQNPEPPKSPEKECLHYWYNVTVDRSTSAKGSVILNGECWNCGDKLTKEVITFIDREEWASAMSQEGMKSFTLNNGITYTNYDENGSMSWRVSGESKIYTEEYFVNTGKNSVNYVTENFSGYLLMYNDFKYDDQTKSYVHKINDTSRVEIMFADGKLFSVITVSGSSKTEYKYLNHGVASAGVPQYFFNMYENVISEEAIKNTSLSADMAEKVSAFLKTLSFELPHEISFLENGGLSVYFYVANGENDPIFGEKYESVTVVAQDEKITGLTIGNNTIDLK